MGWANCGEDSNGRQIGYAHAATCDHPDCTKQIHRGLAYACGPMHGAHEWDCEKYFCEEHRIGGIVLPEGEHTSLCQSCYDHAIQNGYDDEAGRWPGFWDGSIRHG